MCRRLPLLNAGALLLAACTLQAAIPPGPAPKTFDATIRYRIDAFRNERIPQFRALRATSKQPGFRETRTMSISMSRPIVVSRG